MRGPVRLIAVQLAPLCLLVKLFLKLMHTLIILATTSFSLSKGLDIWGIGSIVKSMLHIKPAKMRSNYGLGLNHYINNRVDI
jgi:hypothetical protein